MNRVTIKDVLQAFAIVLLLSALAGYMDKQDGVNGHGQVESQESQ